MEKIGLDTGEMLNIGPGGLYTPMPVPAYKVLSWAGQYQAPAVLNCLSSYLGKPNRKVWPSCSG